jgi:hypothetical protein
MSGKDFIDLVGQAGSDQATLVIDGRRSAPPCVKDEIQHGSHVSVDNLLGSGNCNSETAVFAADNAMRLVDTSQKWTDPPGDHLSVSMTRPVDVPLVVWVLTLSGGNVTFAQEQAQVALEVNRATQLYDTMQCGVAFTTTAINDATGKSFSITLPNADCQRKKEFKKVGFDGSGKINVYYIDDVAGNQGETCRDGASDVILIGASINDTETLAHELGHAQSLAHSNLFSGMPAGDLMLSPGTNRKSLSLGQCFRANVNTSSVLNRSHYRLGGTRSCPDSLGTPQCPDVALHP